MMKTWINAAKREGKPLERLSNMDMDGTEKLFRLLDPMERLFTKLEN